MSRLIPLHEFESPVAQRYAETDIGPFPFANPQQFSLEMASRLMQLCVAAEHGSNTVLTVEREGDVFVALQSAGDPADLLNVRGATSIQPVAFGSGQAYGPLALAYRNCVLAALGGLPASRRLWLTGHGIGGIYALLAAIDLSSQGHLVAAVYTFGAPRIGNRDFRRRFPCPVFRIVNNLDVMVTMPTPWKWRHVGHYKLINADGSLNARPNALNRLPSLIRQTLWLGELLRDGLASGYPRALYKLLGQVLGDHAPEAYAARLDALRSRAK